ncbi:MAG: nuclear transport factor 2 family protein [Alphaproteobacteria bacterium]|nr:nuclear transport factor 2 family protein [Alphaproteobacteria bacterium]
MALQRRHLGIVGIGALAFVGSGIGFAALAQSADETAVAKAVEAFRDAMLKKDKAAFEKLCAEEMSYGHSAGRMETKAQFIADATGTRSEWKSITLSDASVQIVGTNAIARHKLTGETLSEGKTNAINIGILMVWTKQGADWKLLARQAYRL